MDNFFENLEKVIHMLDFSTKLSSIPLAIHIRQITILLKRKKLSPKEKAIRENPPQIASITFQNAFHVQSLNLLQLLCILRLHHYQIIQALMHHRLSPPQVALVNDKPHDKQDVLQRVQ